ncbi:histidine kinase dimerization/phosphoacceptor domain -containing protein [uncultured Methanobacterium sp.]|uniref:histidine kinase dimerization/phosphoacceptor domain -containing protein n=1 Tax=uncultured Methanobacterium sp. TaxID=176306 RepID=UPI002AA81E8F|nr:histidine kinase dimerization/phosphoacceptor domain -containing protein [uncultured Methanobacterium sp.]
MEQELGDGWAEGVHPDDFDHCFEVYSTAFEAREPFEMEYRLLHNTGEYKWILDMAMPFYDLDENFAGYIGSCYDIAKQKELVNQIEKSLEEKELLLKEIHHRVKNNLMIISSLLNLQSRYIEDKKYKDIFQESQNRAKSMALIHERLYRSADLKKIDFGDYIRTLANDLFHTYISDPSSIQMVMDIEEVRLDINTAIPLGLIVNELISNSMKHAFPDGMKGKININFHLKDDEFILTVRDNGVGFPKDLDYKNTESLGLQIINSLTDQIDGTLEFNGVHGTEFKIIFKEGDYS